MVKTSVQVCVRTRPTVNFAQDSIRIDCEKNAIDIHVAKQKKQVINNQLEDWTFGFDHVLHNSPQEVVYDTCARELVDNVLSGINGTILAYGQTGAGKTFTMSGGTQQYKNRGIIPRALAHIYNTIANRPETSIQVRISYLEVYNEMFYDLLDDSGATLGDLAVRDDALGQVSVKGLKKVVCENEQSALNILFTGETNRAIAAHDMNKESSRSHCVFSIHLESRSKVEAQEKIVYSKLNLVDLAGSERVGKTGSSGATLTEARYINRSLSYLEQVVVALSQKRRDHVPYRQSKLTNVLRDSLGGNCKTRLIANIWAESAHLDETLSTLKFASRMMKITNDVNVNVQMDPMLLVKKYEQQIKDLRAELAMHDTLANRSNVSYDPYTPEEQYVLYETVRKYVCGESNHIDVVNIRQINELFRQFRLYAHNLQVQMGGADGAAAAAAALAAAEGTTPPSASSIAAKQTAGGEQQQQQRGIAGSAGGVGEVHASSGGFGVGIAPTGSRPPPDTQTLSSMLASGATTRAIVSPTSSSPNALSSSSSPSSRGYSSSELQQQLNASTSAARGAKLDDIGEEEAMALYRAGDGAEQHALFQENKHEVRATKQKLRDTSLAINATKSDIDILSQRLAAKRDERQSLVNDHSQSSDVIVIDEEEYDMIRVLKQTKARYTDLQAKRATLANEVSYLKKLTENAKVNFCRSFLAWHQANYNVIAVDGSGGAGGGDNDDPLDDGEEFDRLQLSKIQQQNADSLGFYTAKKGMQATLRQQKRVVASPTMKKLQRRHLPGAVN